MTNKSKSKYVFFLVLICVLSISVSVSPVQADKLDEYHEFDNFEVEVSQAEDSSGDPITNDGTAVYNIEVVAEYTNDSYPFIYPIKIEYYDITGESPTIGEIRSNSGSYNKLGSNVIYLNPTESDRYIPKPSGKNKKIVEYKYKTTATFEGIESSGTVNRNVVFNIVSRHTNDKYPTDTAEGSVLTDVDGPTPADINQGQQTIEEGIDSITDNNYVESFRITEDEADSTYLENNQLPSPAKDDLGGEVNRFTNMQKRNGTAIISSEGGDFDMITVNTVTSKSTESTPQTLVVSYNIINGDQVTLDILNSKGNEIEESTEYHLKDDAGDSENCREVSDADRIVCTFTLRSEETDKISKLGESYIHYQMSKNSKASIGCQMIQTGYSSRDDEVCGYPSESNDPPENPPVISFEEFSGQADKQSGSWQEDKVVLERTLLPDNLEFKLDVGTLTGDGYDGFVNYVVAKQGNVDADSFTETVKDDYYKMSDDSTTDWVDTFKTDDKFGEDDLSVKYFAYICKGKSTCTPSDYEERRSIEFVLPGPAGFTLRTSDPVNVILDEYTREDITTRYRTKETTDGDYHTEHTEWNCVSGDDPDCSNPSPNEDFTGGITEKVVVEDVTDSSTIQDARNDQRIDKADEKVSDPEGGSPELIDPSNGDPVVLKTVGRQIRFATDTSAFDNPDDWEPLNAGGSRRAKVGTETKYSSITGKDSFRSIVGGTEKWYPVRPYDEQPGGERTSTFQDRTIQQHEDPDDCLNCLPSEDLSEAEERVENNLRINEVIKSEGDINIWKRESDEPLRRVDLVRDSSSLSLNPSVDAGQYRVFNNYIYQDKYSDLNYTHRKVDFERKDIYNWIRSDKAKKAMFKKPTYDSVNLYEKVKYDVESYYKSDISGSNHALHEYRKPVKDATYDFKLSDTVWIDISESTESTEQISHFSIRFDGSTRNYGPIEWNDQIHKTDPDDIGDMSNSEIISNFDACDSDVTKSTVDSDYHGLGGEVRIHTCEDTSGDKIVLRIGKKYDEPDVYNPDVYMAGEKTGEQADVFEVYVDSETESKYSGSSPDIKNIEPINKKADSVVGTIAIKGTIESNTAKLDQKYRLTVSPADVVGTTGSCDEDFSGYSTDNRLSIQRSEQGGFVATQSIVCEMNDFTQTDAAPEKFDFYTVYEYDDRDDVEYTWNTGEDAVIPSGALQDCSQLGLDSGTSCELQDGSGGTNTIDLGSTGSWNEIDSKKIFNSQHEGCPDPYSKTEESVPFDLIGNSADSATAVKCELDASKEIELRNRPITVRYQSVSSAEEIIESCSDIPATSEVGTHSGYERAYPDTFPDKCKKVDNNDPGPGESVDDKVDIGDLDPGAFRGGSLLTGEENELCTRDTINEGVPTESGTTKDLICHYEEGNTDLEIRYGTLTTGTWKKSATPDASLLDPTDTSKDVWSGNFVYDDGDRVDVEEEFVTTINPRRLPLSGREEFTFTLIKGSDSEEVVEQQKVEINICRYNTFSADNLRDLAVESDGDNIYHCKDFDPILGSDPVIQNKAEVPVGDEKKQKTVQSAMDYAYDRSGDVEVFMLPPMNDACPYTSQYPRAESELKDEGFEFRYTIETDNSRADERAKLSRKLRQDTMSYYSLKGKDPCNDEGTAVVKQQKEPRDTLEFGPNTFTVLNGLVGGDDGISRDFIRTATLGDIAQYDSDPAQSGWSKQNIGGIRIGNPVYGDVVDSSAPNNGVNENLVSQYSFDHNPNANGDGLGSVSLNDVDGSEPILFDPDRYKIQDVNPSKLVEDVKTGREQYWTSLAFTAPDYSAKLWYTTECTSVNSQRVHSELPDTNGECDGLTEEEVRSDSDFDAAPFDTSAFLESKPSAPIEVPSDEYNSGEGIFAGSSITVDDHSWLMFTPPCVNKNVIGNDPKRDLTGNLKLTDGPCSDSEIYRGGLRDIHDETSGINNLEERLDSEDGWSVSFWVKRDNSEIPSPSEDTIEESTGSYRTLFSIGVPATGLSYDSSGEIGTVRQPPYLTETLALNRMYIPKSVDVEGVGDVNGGGDYTGDEKVYLSETSKAYAEPNEQMAEDCLTYDTSSSHNPPILCDVLIDKVSEARNYDELQLDSIFWSMYMTKYPGITTEDSGVVDPTQEEKETALKKELRAIALGYDGYDQHVNYELGFDWTASDRTYKSEPGVYGGNEDYPGPGSYHNISESPSCDGSYERKIAAGGSNNQCFDSRYRMEGQITSDGYKDSNWKHMIMTYEGGSDRSEVNIYENGELVKTVNAGVEPPQNGFYCRDPVGGGTNCNDFRPYGYNDLGRTVPPLVKQFNTDSWGYHDDETVDTTIDSGRIYDRGVVAIGGQYYNPSYLLDRDGNTKPNITTDPEYRPYVTATSGEFEIDEVRFYSEPIGDDLSEFTEDSRMYPTKVDPNNHGLDTTKPMYIGNVTLKTDTAMSGSNNQDISSVMDNAAIYDIKINAKGKGSYRVDVSVCDSGGRCSNTPTRITQTSLEEELNTRSLQRVIPYEGLDNSVDEFKFEVQLGSDDIDESPVINSIEITPTPMFTSCQKLEDEYIDPPEDPDDERSSPISGSNFNATVAPHNIPAETKCDMSTRNGGWTMFSWFEEGSVKPDKGLMGSQDISKCELDDSYCFGKANFTAPEELNDMTRYDADNPSELNPQILIKGITDGNTVGWAAFELDSGIHHIKDGGEHNLQLESGFSSYDKLGATRYMSWIDGNGLNPDRKSFKNVVGGIKDTSGNREGVVIDATDYETIDENDYADEKGFRSGDEVPIENCLYPYATSESVSNKENARCITDYKSSEDKFEITQRKTEADDGSDVSWHNTQYNWLTVERADDGSLDNIECLEDPTISPPDQLNPERCEIYYSTGDALNKAGDTPNLAYNPDAGTYDNAYVASVKSNIVDDDYSTPEHKIVGGYVFEAQKDSNLAAIQNDYDKAVTASTSAPSDFTRFVGVYEWSYADGAEDVVDQRIYDELTPDNFGVKNSYSTDAELDPGKEYVVIVGGTGSSDFLGTSIVSQTLEQPGIIQKTPDVNRGDVGGSVIELKRAVSTTDLPENSITSGGDTYNSVKQHVQDATFEQDTLTSTNTNRPISIPDIDMTILYN